MREAQSNDLMSLSKMELLTYVNTIIDIKKKPMDKTEISKKLTFLKDYIHESEFAEVEAICNLYEMEIERLKKY